MNYITLGALATSVTTILYLVISRNMYHEKSTEQVSVVKVTKLIFNYNNSLFHLKVSTPNCSKQQI